jgi:hypothetical protein
LNGREERAVEDRAEALSHEEQIEFFRGRDRGGGGGRWGWGRGDRGEELSKENENLRI